MTGYLLDTNIISNATKPKASERLQAWLSSQPNDRLFICSLTIGEIQHGILVMPSGRKRRYLEEWFSGPTGPFSRFAGRILPFDLKASTVWARLMAEGKAVGQPRDHLDMIVASIAVANHCTLITDNERDFRGLKIINPMRAY